MFNLNDTMRYYLCPEPICMRKGINGLCGVVHEQMGCEVKNGDVFIFGLWVKMQACCSLQNDLYAKTKQKTSWKSSAKRIGQCNISG